MPPAHTPPAPPASGALILLFLLLTLADVAFNLSRQFICVFAELCEPAQLGVDRQL